MHITRIRNEKLTHFPNTDKVRRFEDMPNIISSLKVQGKTVVLAQGVFDLVHVGHVAYLRACHEIDSQNCVVIVGIDNDETVRNNKGSGRPINPLQDRVQLISELKTVDYVFGYNDVPDYSCPDDYVKRYRTLSPSVVAASARDQYLDLKKWQADQAGTRLEVVWHPYENSTTAMLQQVGYE